MASDRELIVGALQLPTLGMNATRLEFYLKNAQQRGVRVMMLGEYVLNHFFKELVKMPSSMVKEQTDRHLQSLKIFANRYNIIFVAPVIQIKKGKYYKAIAKVTASRIGYYQQQILLPYPHWNEKAFFSNPIEPLKRPLLFTVDGFRVMVMGGFELHFDFFWQKVVENRVDIVLLPTSSTFGSHNRWREIIKTKAFLHSCYILRANRLGEYKDDTVQWKFYGDSMLVNPDGDVEMVLEDKESMLIEEISKRAIVEHRKSWGFERELALRKTNL